jgi:DNA repair protein RecO (recombination protein O)
MRVELASAYVLHTRPYRNSSLLVDAFSAQFGRISLVAKGASRPRSALQAIRHLFSLCALSWVGHSDLKTLTGVQDLGQPLWLTGKALMSGLYVNELLVKLMDHEDPHPDLFDYYALVIAQLAQGQDPAVVLRLFEKELIVQLGYDIGLDHSELVIEAQGQYCFDPQCGIRQVLAGEEAAQCAVSGETLLALRAESLEVPQVLREARVFLRAVIMHCLGGVRLNSPLVWRQSFRE